MLRVVRALVRLSSGTPSRVQMWSVSGEEAMETASVEESTEKERLPRCSTADTVCRMEAVRSAEKPMVVSASSVSERSVNSEGGGSEGSARMAYEEQ
jgi:hypothetical protein